METPETIRTSLQGEWVTSIDFKDAYFISQYRNNPGNILHPGPDITIQALPFGLSTAPLEFTVIVKEVKLMAMHKGIRIHQYLDDWLVRAKSHQVYFQHTQDLVKMCQDLGWLVNIEKSELEPKQVFDFVGYQFDLRSGLVRPTPNRWQSLQEKIKTLSLLPTCPVRQFMSLIGLLTATEKQVHLGRLHMRPIQWHLKNNWRVPESLDKMIQIPRSLHPHFGTQTQQQMEIHTGPKQTESVPQGGKIQNGDTGNHQNIPPARGVGHLDRFQGCLLPCPNTGTIQEISEIPCPGPDIPIQSTSFRSVHSALGVHCNSKGGETDGHTQGIRIHQYLDDWLVRATSHQVCLQHTQTLAKMCQDLGWLVNVEKSEFEPKQVFDFVGYQFDL